MNGHTFTNKGRTYRRVTRRTALNAYQQGKDVVMVPCNIRPFTEWHPEYVLNRKTREEYIVDEIGVVNDFKNQVASYENYNCINRETGRYAAFYITQQ